jgi:hypothetical protein
MDRERAEAAEAEAYRLGNVLLAKEEELAWAVEDIERLEDEPRDTAEQAAAFNSRWDMAQQELERLKLEVAEAKDDSDRAYEDWEYYSGQGDDDDDAGEDAGERLSVEDAADIWLCSGMDEDRMFGYTEEELREAADL